MPASDFNAGPTQGMGSGTVKVSPIKKNTGSSDKVAYLKVTIAGQSPKFIKLTQQTGDYIYEYEFVATNNIINFGANGGTRQATITSTRKSYMDGQLVSTEDWPFSVKEHDEGLQVDGINITMPENTSSMPGVKQVIYVQQDSGKEVVIECNQLGASVEEDIIFEVTPQSLNFEEGASTQSVTVTSQSIKIVNEGEQQVEDIPYTASPSESWISANGNQIGVTANPNTSVRSGTVTFTQEGTNRSIEITINQAAHVQTPSQEIFLYGMYKHPNNIWSSPMSTISMGNYTAEAQSKLPLGDYMIGFKVDALDGELLVGSWDYTWEEWEPLLKANNEHIHPLVSSDWSCTVDTEGASVDTTSTVYPTEDESGTAIEGLESYWLKACVNLPENNTGENLVTLVTLKLTSSSIKGLVFSYTQEPAAEQLLFDNGTNNLSVTVGETAGFNVYLRPLNNKGEFDTDCTKIRFDSVNAIGMISYDGVVTRGDLQYHKYTLGFGGYGTDGNYYIDRWFNLGTTGRESTSLNLDNLAFSYGSAPRATISVKVGCTTVTINTAISAINNIKLMAGGFTSAVLYLEFEIDLKFAGSSPSVPNLVRNIVLQVPLQTSIPENPLEGAGWSSGRQTALRYIYMPNCLGLNCTFKATTLNSYVMKINNGFQRANITHTFDGQNSDYKWVVNEHLTSNRNMNLSIESVGSYS